MNNILMAPPLSDPSRKCAAEQDERRNSRAAGAAVSRLKHDVASGPEVGENLDINGWDGPAKSIKSPGCWW